MQACNRMPDFSLQRMRIAASAPAGVTVALTLVASAPTLVASAPTLVAVALTVVALAGAAPAHAQTPEVQWRPMESLNAELPAAVQVFSGADPDIPLRAWYVSVSPGADSVRTEVLLSADEQDRRERVSAFAANTGACVVVNGGFFSMERTPAMHAGLLVLDGEIEAPATRSVVRGDIRYETARAALGVMPDGFDIAWATSRDGRLQAWPEPPPHVPGSAATLEGEPAEWPVEDALGAGPALVSNGQVRVTTNEEVFFGSAIPDTHPRTAAGIRDDGTLLLLVVDGRQPVSRGVDLEQLAAIMVDIGANEALNLDGGGSSALSVNGGLVNRPSGITAGREVMSAIGVFCD